MRGRIADLDERIVFVGADSATTAALTQNGWRVTPTAAEEALRLYGALNAPRLLFIDPNGKIRYNGGFARRSDFRDGFQEARIWSDLQSGRETDALPAYGCALEFNNAGGLDAAMRRLGVKYNDGGGNTRPPGT
jgi:hypothetical protein